MIVVFHQVGERQDRSILNEIPFEIPSKVNVTP